MLLSQLYLLLHFLVGQYVLESNGAPCAVVCILCSFLLNLPDETILIGQRAAEESTESAWSGN
jgi:hypothetical protein